MSSIKVNRLRKEDFPGLLEAEPKFEQLLISHNAMQDQLAKILNKGVGVDNLNVQHVTINVIKAQVYPMKIKPTISGKAVGVHVLQIVKTTTIPAGEAVGDAITVDWTNQTDTDGTAYVSLDGLAGSDDAESYRVTLEIIGA